MDWMELKRKEETLQEALALGHVERATGIVRTAGDPLECEFLIRWLFSLRAAPRELIETALDTFARSHRNTPPEHAKWVHSLSHFISVLWERRLTTWIAQFYATAFRGANALAEPTCCDRLVYAFDAFAHWSDDPREFHLDQENLRWMKWEKHNEHVRVRLQDSPFDSEQDFLCWKIKHPDCFCHWDNESQRPRVSVEEVHAVIRKLAAQGVDVSEFIEVERHLIITDIEELLAEIADVGGDQMEYLVQGIQKDIKFLESIAYPGEARKLREAGGATGKRRKGHRRRMFGLGRDRNVEP